MSNLGKYWIGLGISVVLLAVFVLTVDVGGMLDALSEAEYAYVVPAAAMYLVSLFFRSLRWRLLLMHMKRVPVGAAVPGGGGGVHG